VLCRPPPPVIEMPATFNLELQPGRTVALDTICAADDELDMSRTEDGTLVDGKFWGVLKITHEGETHQVDFSGTRLTADMPKDYFFDQRTISKLLIATKPTTARCNLTIRCPAMQYVDLNISLAGMWSWGVTYPQAESVADGKVKVSRIRFLGNRAEQSATYPLEHYSISCGCIRMGTSSISNRILSRLRSITKRCMWNLSFLLSL
jgi:hypothetical protein